MKNRRSLVLILAFLKVRAFTFDGEYMIISLLQASYQTQFVRGYVIKLFCFILSQNTLKHLLSLLPFQV